MKKEYDIKDFNFLIDWLLKFNWDQDKEAYLGVTYHKQIAHKLVKEGILKYMGDDDFYEKYEINL